MMPLDPKPCVEADGESGRGEGELFGLAWRLAPVGSGITELASGRFLAVNEGFLELCGYSHAEVQGQTALGMGLWANPADRETVLARLARDGRVRGFQAPIRCKDGTTRWMSYAGRLVELDGQQRLLSAAVDITDQRLAAQALEEKEYLFRQAERAAAIGSYKADFLRGVWTSSEVLDGIFGIDSDYPRSIQGWLDLVHPEDRASLADYLTTEVIGARRPFRKAYRIVRPRDGETRWVHGLGAVSTDGADQVIGLFGTIQDITEAKAAEAEKAELQSQLLHAQKMRSLFNLAGGVAHDMNNVLGAILALATAHLARDPGDGALGPTFATIRDAAQRGADLVRGLQTLASEGPGRLEPLDLNRLLLDQCRLLERTTLARIRLELDLAPDLRPMSGDASALASVFVNLCVNAAEAMPDGGTLFLQTLNQDDGWIEVRVLDSGRGMSQEVLGQAMEPFFTTKAEGRGVGLGLAVVYAAVKAHRGQIELLSKPGQGTRVKLRFPSVAAPPPAGPQGEAGRLRVLLVDDDELIRKSCGLLLDMLGHEVQEAVSGEDAVARIEQGLKPDVIILDMNMPGMGGRGALPRLRRGCPGVPIIIATGRADPEVAALTAAHPGVVLLPKPFSLGELQLSLGRLTGLGMKVSVDPDRVSAQTGETHDPTRSPDPSPPAS